ncbi:MAG: tetratricopeptide repeat protein, partial [Microcystaceae cyanobacterium]
MQIDAYSARLQLPSRSWRLYRTGGMGELNFYIQRLRDRAIPCFSVPVQSVLSLRVFPVYYFESVFPSVTLKYRLNKEETADFEFSWSEVSQRVEGLLPIFEECVDVNKNGKVEYKTAILDYAKVCDLHLPERNLILRFCDQIYEFQEGISLLDPNKSREREGTTHEQWQKLLSIFQEKLPQAKVWNEFKPFAETALDFQELLKLINPHIHFIRQEETNWDQAFHLYSSLAFFYSSLSPVPTQ